MPERALADVEQEIDEYITTCRQTPEVQTLLAEEPLCVIKYVPASYLATVLATGQLYASERAGFTWGDAIYVAPLKTPRTTMMYGHVGIVGTYSIADTRIFDADNATGIRLYQEWITHQTTAYRQLTTTIHAPSANQDLRLEARRLGAVSINVRITAVRKLAVEAADNGLLAPELAAGITRVKGVASKGVRLGNWLSVRQAQTLLNTPDVTTTKALRDRAILAVLLGCGLRRCEVAALTVGHVQQRDGRWCIVDLVGKHGRVRTIPMPTWVKVATDAWTTAAGVADGYVFRPVNRAGQVQVAGLSEKVVWQLLQPYALAAGVPGIAPHDCRRLREVVLRGGR